jgi:hypothetical protein
MFINIRIVLLYNILTAKNSTCEQIFMKLHADLILDI